MFRQMFEEKYMRFPGGKSKAATFSYDDGVVADKRLVEILDRHNLKGTFNLNSLLFDCERWHGRMDEQQTYLTFYSRPHEVALHGARHIYLDKVPTPEAVNEDVQNRRYLEDRFDRIVRGMAYAYNGFNDKVKEVLKMTGIAYARTTFSTHSFGVPVDFLEWNPTCHHTDPELFGLLDKFLNTSPEAEFKHREPYIFYVWGHSYEFDDDGNWDMMESLAQKLGGRGDIWYATNIEICDYVNSYRSLIFSLDGEQVYNPTCRPVFIEIRGKVYEVAPDKRLRFDKEI